MKRKLKQKQYFRSKQLSQDLKVLENYGNIMLEQDKLKQTIPNQDKKNISGVSGVPACTQLKDDDIATKLE